jgi:hypothetical protein
MNDIAPTTSERLSPTSQYSRPNPAPRGVTFSGWIKGIRFRQILSIPFWLAAFGLLFFADVLPQMVPANAFLEASRAGTMGDLIGVILMVIAARLGASTAAQLRALQPGRRPVLYLRSFKADKNPFSTSSDEETLSRIFRAIGPFVGIAEPGERLPEIGSAKMSVSGDKWQQVVTDQIREASLVVLNIGATPGFKWEVRRALELADPERLLIYFSVHADEYHLQSMYFDFVEAARELIPHPFPPVKEIGTRRFICFDAERRPELFGPIERPRTRWRKVVGVLSLGMGLIVLRPIVAERLRHRMSAALAPMRARFDDAVSNRRLWGRLTMAVGLYFGGLAAFLPMFVWNAWRASTRAKIVALACVPLVLLGPVNEVVGFFSIVFAIVAYLAWPILMPAPSRRHIALGGPVFGVVAAALVIVLAVGVQMFVPRGIPQRVSDVDRAALFDVDALRAGLPSAFAMLGQHPTELSSSKSSSLDGSYELSYRLESGNLDLNSTLTRVGSPINTAIAQEFGSDFPGFDSQSVGDAWHDRWRISLYKLSQAGTEIGVGAMARNGSLQYKVFVSGLRIEPDDLVVMMRPRLDAAESVRGLVPPLLIK